MLDYPFARSPWAFSRLVAAALTAVAVGIVAPLRAALEPSGRVVLIDSLKPVAEGGASGVPVLAPRELSREEHEEILDIVISLRLRHSEDLTRAVRARNRVNRATLESTYLPQVSDYNQVSEWLEGQGLTLTLQDSLHTHLFARGSIRQLAKAFSVSFARVSTSEGEMTSAVPMPGAPGPSIPIQFADVVLGIDGLQPHIRMHPATRSPDIVTTLSGHFTPADIAAAYHVPSDLNGSGQTVAIVMAAVPTAGDYAAFHVASGIADTGATVTVIPILGGPTLASQASNLGEVTLDTEWATALAPGANLRLYAVPSLTSANLLAACVQILNDGLAKQVSYSASGAENEYSQATLAADSQLFTEMAASGITMFCSSGDGGSNPNPPSVGNGYNAAAPLMVEYPASDASVTSVGGTTLVLDSDWALVSEGAWTPGRSASGGGLSQSFVRPYWQTGPGVPGGSQRCLPDVAGVSTVIAGGSANAGALVIQNGVPAGRSGTSLSSPLWAGLTALINEARARAGLPSLGLLGPWIYPLIGTAGFNDVTTGNNGAYPAGPGYDLCTGVGSPNLGTLIAEINQEAVPASDARLLNVSARANLVLGSESLVAGFGISGAAPKSVLIRGVGPGLGNYGVSGFLAAPHLILFDSGGALLASDFAWGGTAPLVSAMAQVGAFALAPTSLDSAILSSLAPGTYSAQVASSGALLGSVLAEVYDADSLPVSRLVNVSAKAGVQPGVGALTAGFVVAAGPSGAPESVLVRGVGPALGSFGVPGFLADPILTVFDASGLVVATNAGWGIHPSRGPSQVNAAVQPASAALMQAVGAFSLTAGSSDDAMVLALPAGAYTAQLTGANGSSGVGQVEVYEVR